MTLPRVTVVVTAYGVERFIGRALDSALGQTYPADLLDVVVVDDGSIDGTPAILRRYRDRIQVIRQDNAGLRAAVARGLAAASGELIALLDGDDAWPEDKLARQVDLLLRRPEVGLVHGDMQVVGADDRPLHASFFQDQRMDVRRGDVFGRLLHGNFVTTSAVVVRAALLPLLLPIPDVVPWPDWWLALRVAEVAEIDHLDTPVSRYRLHGANMCLGATGEQLARSRRGDIGFRRWMLANLWRSRASVADLAVCHRVVEAYCHELAGLGGGGPTDAAPVSRAERGRAERAFEAGLASTRKGDTEAGARLFLRALGHDPWHGPARAELGWSLHLLEGAASAAATGAPLRPDASVLDARSFVAATGVTDILRTPRLLRAFADAFGPDDDATLVVLAPDYDEAQLGDVLLRALDISGVTGERCPDVLALAGAAAAAALPCLRDRARVVLADGESGLQLSRAPLVGPGGAAELRARAGLARTPALEKAA